MVAKVKTLWHFTLRPTLKMVLEGEIFQEGFFFL
jgi:hypothetical protein